MAKEIEPTRGLMALLMIHDVSPWVSYCNVAVMNEALSALDAFGHVDADFVGYFEKEPPAITDMPDVYTSVYKRRDGCSLLIIANLSKTDRHGEVRVNLTRLDLKRASFMNWPDKQPLPSTDGRLTLDIPRHGYRMVRVSK